MAERELSSLDRFLTSRAPVLAGIVNDTLRFRVLAAIGGVYGLAGLGSLLAAFLTREPAAAGAASVFLCSGAVMGGVSAMLRSRLRPEEDSHVRLSPEATQLVRQLLTYLYGWRLAQLRIRRRRLRRILRRGFTKNSSDHRSEDALTPASFRVLDGAAREYNRVQGVLADRENGALRKLAPSVRAAADEAMAEVLHTAALLNRLPEAESAREAATQARIAELRELAERVEQLAATGTDALEEGAQSTRIQTLLDDLRAEQEARLELQPATASEPEQVARVSPGL